MKHKKNSRYQLGTMIFDSYQEMLKLFGISSKIADQSLEDKDVLVYDERHQIIGYKESIVSKYTNLGK